MVFLSVHKNKNPAEIMSFPENMILRRRHASGAYTLHLYYIRTNVRKNTFPTLFRYRVSWFVCIRRFVDKRVGILRAYIEE